jgi:hypothetical protein
MGSPEWEISSFMIKCLLRNWGNVLRSAFVFRVALLAFALLLETPVRSLLLLDVLSNVFVAIETESGLCRFVESLVTLGAVLFPLGMALDHLARHEGGFDSVGPSVIREERA